MTNNEYNARLLHTDGHTVDESPENDNELASTEASLSPNVYPTEEWHDLRAFQRDLLKALAQLGSVKGLTAKKRLKTFYKGEVYNGRLYPNLDDLVERELVAKETIDGRTNAYQLTDWGRTVLKEHERLLQEGQR